MQVVDAQDPTAHGKLNVRAVTLKYDVECTPKRKIETAIETEATVSLYIS